MTMITDETSMMTMIMTNDDSYDELWFVWRTMIRMTNDDSYDDYTDANKRQELWAKEEAKDDRQLDKN